MPCQQSLNAECVTEKTLKPIWIWDFIRTQMVFSLKSKWAEGRCFHPVTLEKSTSEGQFQARLDALDAFPEFNAIFTKTNADTDCRIVNRLIDDYAGKHPESCFAVNSLGTWRYLSAMKFCTAVIGNSSSGIVEAPSFKVPTINIGDHQKGRFHTTSIIDCEPTKESINSAMIKASSTTPPMLRERLKSVLIIDLANSC